MAFKHLVSIICCALYATLGSKAQQPSIAILGGGASGITSAAILTELGYENVTIFESAIGLGGVATTHLVQGKAYDMATMFIPGGGISGAGIEATLQRFIDYSEEKLVHAVDFDYLNASTKEVKPAPIELLDSTPVPQIKSELIQGLAVSSQLAVCAKNGVDCVTCQVCASSSESILQWGSRTGLNSYAQVIATVIDGLGANPGAAFPAKNLLLSSFAVVDVVYTLKGLGATKDEIPPALTNIIEVWDEPRWYSFEYGYETFWESLVENLNIDVERNTKVETMVATTSGTTEITLEDGAVRTFDKVIVATPAAAALQFLPAGPQYDAISLAKVHSPPNDVFILEVKFADKAEQKSTFSYWPDGFGAGSYSMLDPNVGGFAKPIFWVKRHENRQIITVGTVALGTTTEQNYNAVVSYAETIGITVKRQLHHERYYFPDSPSDSAAFSATWNTLQGENGWFFTGEAFSGSGVPAITFYNNNFIKAIFPALVSPQPTPTPSSPPPRPTPPVCFREEDGYWVVFVTFSAVFGVFFAGKKRGHTVEKRQSLTLLNQVRELQHNSKSTDQTKERKSDQVEILVNGNTL